MGRPLAWENAQCGSSALVKGGGAASCSGGSGGRACLTQPAKAGEPSTGDLDARPLYWLEQSKNGDTWLFFKDGVLASMGTL